MRRATDKACQGSGSGLRLWEGLPHHLGTDRPVLSHPPWAMARADASYREKNRDYGVQELLRDVKRTRDSTTRPRKSISKGYA